MYLSNRPRRKTNWRRRNWLTLAAIYAVTGFIFLVQDRSLPLFSTEPTPTATATPGPSAEALERLARGDLYFDQGNLTAAMESYQEAVAADPELAIAHARWGLLLTLRQKYDEALIRTERAVALAPDDPDVLAYRAMALEWSGDIPGAIEVALRAIELDPNHAAAHAFLAEAYVDSQRYDEALATAQQAVELDPDEVWAWRNLGWVNENFQRYPEAIAAYEEAIRVKPLSYLYLSLGRHERFQGNYDAALAHFREATVVDPRNPEPYAELGLTHYSLQSYEAATVSLEQGIEHDPTFARNYALLGIVQYAQRNYEGAIGTLEQAVSFGSSSEEVFYILGQSYALLEQCDAAVPWLERALTENPEYEVARNAMQLCSGS